MEQPKKTKRTAPAGSWKTYFILSQKLERLKIGKSRDETARIRDFGCANPDNLVLLGLLDGDREGEFHHRFDEYRINRRREWFSLGPKLADFLKAEFKCVLRQRKRPMAKSRAESWPVIVDRAETLFGCGLRHTDYDDFEFEMLPEIQERAPDEEDSEPGEWIVWGLQKWWPWVMGWNVKDSDGRLNFFLLFKRPDLARMRVELLEEIAHWGYLSDKDGVEFIRLNIALCWRTRHGGDFVGEIAGPVIVDDGIEMIFHDRPSLKAIGMDELLGFKVLGDTWYRQNGLPPPAEAMEMAKQPLTEPNICAYSEAHREGNGHEETNEHDFGRRPIPALSDTGDRGTDLSVGDPGAFDGGVSR